MMISLITPYNEILETNTFSFTYKDVYYSSPYTLDQDSIMIFEDVNISNLINEIKANPSLATLIRGENIYFFDSESEMQEYTKNKQDIHMKAIYNYSVYGVLKISCHSRNSGKGNAFYVEVDATRPEYALPIMLEGWNDAISSCKITGYIINGGVFANTPSTTGIIFYEHINFAGKSLMFEDLVAEKKDYSHRDYFSSFGFDRIASSMKVFIHNGIKH